MKKKRRLCSYCKRPLSPKAKKRMHKMCATLFEISQAGELKKKSVTLAELLNPQVIADVIGKASKQRKSSLSTWLGWKPTVTTP